MSDNETKTIIINKTILKSRNVLKDFESAIFKEDFWHKFIVSYRYYPNHMFYNKSL